MDIVTTWKGLELQIGEALYRAKTTIKDVFELKKSTMRSESKLPNAENVTTFVERCGKNIRKL